MVQKVPAAKPHQREDTLRRNACLACFAVSVVVIHFLATFASAARAHETVNGARPLARVCQLRGGCRTDSMEVAVGTGNFSALAPNYIRSSITFVPMT